MTAPAAVEKYSRHPDRSRKFCGLFAPKNDPEKARGIRSKKRTKRHKKALPMRRFSQRFFDEKPWHEGCPGRDPDLERNRGKRRLAAKHE